MRVPLLLATLVVAGCVAPSADVTAPQSVRIPLVGEPFTHLVCAGDELLPLGEPREATCNFKVTKPGEGPAAEVHLAASPLDPMLLVGGAKDFRLPDDPRCGRHSVWSGWYRSTDGGRTWTTGLLPGYPGDTRVTALSEYACGSDPVLAFAADGTLYYTSLQFKLRPGEDPPLPQLAPITGYPEDGSAVAITRSVDGGATWEDPVLIDRSDGLLDKQWIAVDPVTQDLHVSYFDEGDVVVKSSRDGGATWGDAVMLLPGADFPPRQGQFAQVAATADGVIHFIAWSAGDPMRPSALIHRASSDRGASWSEPVPIVPWSMYIDGGFVHPYRVVALPALVAHPTEPTLHVVYPAPAQPTAAPRLQPGDLDVFVATSKDGGASWGAPVRINDDLVGPTNGQWMPAAAVGPDGTLHVTWVDYREDPQGQLARIYYARSTDEGASFTANVPLSDVAFDGVGGYHQNGGGTVGDYMGLAVTGDALHAFWADTREGQNDVFSAIVPAR